MRRRKTLFSEIVKLIEDDIDDVETNNLYHEFSKVEVRVALRNVLTNIRALKRNRKYQS
jgi:hypothetical protein